MSFETVLPARVPERIAVHVTPDALRQVRGGHPWIWDRSIQRASPAGRVGDLAVVFDDRRKFAAIGLWDPAAAIPVRILHEGSARTIDGDFFDERLIEAFDRRATLAADPTTTGYRLVHGENDRLPGLVIDRYDATLVAKIDTAAWLPHLGRILATAAELADAERVLVRASRRVEASLPPEVRTNPVVLGDAPDGPVQFLEHGLTFEADVERGQKTGYFLDQRDNRRLLGLRCEGASVLDVFCNAGGFGVHAAAGGARSVTSIDVSAHAIDATRRNMALNRDSIYGSVRHRTLVADAFEAMSDLAHQREVFDVVVVDPPTFAPNEASRSAARRSYRRLTSLALDLLGPQGRLFQASCSSRISSDEFFRLVTDEIAHAGCVPVAEVRTGHAVDHPVGFEHGAYLKAFSADIIAAR